MVRMGDRWGVRASCSIDRVFSSLSRYRCDLLEQLEPGVDSSVNNSSYSPTLDNSSLPYASGSCDVNSLLKPRLASYFVVVHPGAVRIHAGNINPVLPKVPPILTCTPVQETYVVENEFISCTCSISFLGDPPGQLLGYRDDFLLTNGNLSDDTLTLPTQTFGRHDNGTVLRCVLLIDWAEEDEQTLEANLTVNVAYGPEIVELSDPGTFNLHPSGLSTLTLTCNVPSASPSVTFTWQGVCVSHTGNSCTFTPSVGDNGHTVTCAAHNQFTNITMVASVVLDVNYPPRVAPVISGYDGSLLYPGQPLLLFCDVIGGLPLVENVTFICQGQGQEVQGQNSSLNLTVEAGNHGDVCMCTAGWKIPEWYRLRAVTTLIVSQPVEILSVTVNDTSGILTLNESTGDNLSVLCVARGVPSPALTLCSQADKRLASVDGGQLIEERFTTLSALVPARCESSATYTCIAGQDHHQQRANVTLNVLCSPRLQAEDQNSTTPEIDLGLNMSSLTFTLESNPAPSSFRFLSLVEEDSSDVTEQENIASIFIVGCFNTKMTSRHNCVITVSRLAEVREGPYGLDVENGLGRVLVRFRVSRTNRSAEVPTRTPAKQHDYPDTAVIVLGALFAVALLVCFVFGVCWLRAGRRRKGEENEQRLTDSGPRGAELDMTSAVQPASGNLYEPFHAGESRASHLYDTSVIERQGSQNEAPESSYMEMDDTPAAKRPDEQYVTMESTKSSDDQPFYENTIEDTEYANMPGLGAPRKK